MRRILALAVLLAPLPAIAAEPIDGRWIVEDGKAVVTVGPCGPGRCGRISRILKATPGGPVTDTKNPDPALRSKPILGLAILSGFRDDGKAWKGRIYDPTSGKTYRSVVKRAADGTLDVQGCIAFICRGQTWRPAR